MPDTHFLHLDDTKARIAAGDELERQRQELRDRLEAEKAFERVVQAGDYTSFDKQKGQVLTIEDFEARVAKLCPKLLWDTHELSQRNAYVLSLEPGSSCRRIWVSEAGNLRMLASYVNQPYLHEFTIQLMRPKRIPRVLDTFKGIKAQDGSTVQVPFLDPADIPKARKVQREDGTWTHVFEGTSPAEDIVQEPCGLFPGWRQVLVRLIGEGLLTPQAVEAEFGAADNASWAQRLGKQKILLPF